MPLPYFQGTEGEDVGASSGETRSSAVMEGHARRVEDHPPVQLDDPSDDLLSFIYPRDQPAAAVAVPFQQHQSSAALGNQSSGSLQQHSPSSAENQRPFPEQQASATADRPYSLRITENMTSASFEPQSSAPLEFQQHLASPEHQFTALAEHLPSESSDYHTDVAAEDHLSRSGHNLSTASSELMDLASANRQLTYHNPSDPTGHHPPASSELHPLASTEHQLLRATGQMSLASSESISSDSANGHWSLMAQDSLASTGHHPSAPSQLLSSASVEHHASSSAEEQHPLLLAEQQQATEPPSTSGPPARRPVTQSHVERGKLYVSGDNIDAVSRARNDEVPENRMGTGSDVSESSQPRERGSSVLDCIRCETVRLELHPESCQLWSAVPGPCCRKMFSELLKTLREGFVGDNCLHNKCVLNLLKHMLDVPLPENTEVSLQKFRDAERFLGPFVRSNGRCAFLANLEKLATKSRSGRQNKLSWFAGHMDSITAENYLDGKRKGTFLVRFSSTSPASEGSFVISVVAEAQTGESYVEHFLVQGNPEATRNDPSSLHLTFQGRQFPSLIEVVDHARRQGVTLEHQGRVTFTEVCHGLPLQSALTPYR